MLNNSLKKFRFANYLLAFFILLALLFLTRNIVSVTFSGNVLSPASSKGPSSVSVKKKDIMQYAPILEKNPFGRPMKLEPIAIEEKTDKPSGALSDIVLVGTVVGPDELSYAVFENKAESNRQEVFALGKPVFNYGILTKVNRSSVEISRDSSTYTLKFPEQTGKRETRKRSAGRVTAPKNSFAKKVGDREYVLDSRRVQQSLENPEKILTDARLLPNFVNGRQEGFKISEVVPDGLYHSLGLRNKDILLRVNGLEISNPEVAIQAMTALRGMNRVNLDIIRGGKNMSMNYRMR